jgi:hypothetical protein
MILSLLGFAAMSFPSLVLSFREPSSLRCNARSVGDRDRIAVADRTVKPSNFRQSAEISRAHVDSSVAAGRLTRAGRDQGLQHQTQTVKGFIMKRQMAAGVSILAVAAGVGWKLASHPETSARLQDISLIQRSEHSHPGPTDALAGIRIRLSPSDFDNAIRAKAHQVPPITRAAE